MVTIEEVLSQFKINSYRTKTEEDVRVKTNIFLDKISEILGIKNISSSEVNSIKGGRADSIYSNIIFEFKKPRYFHTSKGINEAIYGRDEKDRGLFHYLINFSLEEAKGGDNNSFKTILTSKVGVGFDGENFIFCRFKESNAIINIFEENKTRSFPDYIKKEQELSFEIEVINNFELGVKKLLLFMRSTNRKILSATNLSSSFGNSSQLSSNLIIYLYNLLSTNITTNTRIKTLFEEWSRIFGDIYGEVETEFTKFKVDLIKMYSLPSDIDIKKTLFVLQTYYSIVIKLLINNLLESLTNPIGEIRRPNYQNELVALFSGHGYNTYNVDNFFEIHYFEWFMLAEDLNIAIINDILNELDTYETTTSVIKPEIVQDVLKKVYQNLIPKKMRHLMGEYYTPDRLVDFTIEQSGFDFGISSTALDPSCGSGTFLTHLIKGFKEKYPTMDINQFIKMVTKNIVGFDINPIAVISSKANYILALGDITQVTETITIPIYMCDSILVPTVHAKQIEQKKCVDINTVVGTFEIPMFSTREESDYFLNTASSCILKDYISFKEFFDLLEQEKVIQLDEDKIKIAENFYDKLYKLHLSGKNGFRPIILKNSFAPLFSHDKFNVVIGNPPRITWKAMSDTYRKMTLDIRLSYGIFEKNSYDKITTHDDFAMAVTYVSIDHYLKQDGITAFVLPQTFVKSLKGGEGFRKFEITRDGLTIPFSVEKVFDMLKINPFKGEASNRTSVYVFQKDKKMKYPMHDYYECDNKHTKNPIKYEDNYKDVKNKLIMKQLSAIPINKDYRSPWLTISKNTINFIKNYLGKSPYKARKGVEPCGAKGIYLLKINKLINSEIEIENLVERGRLEKAKELGIHKGIIEKEFVYPMIGGRNFDKWGINSYIYMLLPHVNSGDGIYRGIDESILKVKFKKTYNRLFYFKDILLETRIRSGKFFDQKQFPRYRLDNVGDYTFKKYKVLWKEQSKMMTACVISDIEDQYLGKKKIVTDSKVLYVPCDNEMEAHYLCAILNSRLIGKIIEAYTIDVQKGVDIVNNIKIPIFNSKNKLHIKLGELSKLAHKNYLDKDQKAIIKVEQEIEKLIAKIFS